MGETFNCIMTHIRSLRMRTSNFFKNFGSKSKNLQGAASGTLAYFPIVMTDQIREEHAEVICDALEKKYATLIKIIVGQNDIIDLTRYQSKEDVINQVLNKIVESTDLEIVKETPLNNYNKLNWKEIYLNDSQIVGSEYNFTIINDNTILTEDIVDKLETFAGQVADVDSTFNSQGIVGEVPGAAHVLETRAPRISNDEVKKLNTMHPTMLDFTVVYNNGHALVQSNITIGIKTILHVTESNIMKTELISSIKKNSISFRFVQWLVGEKAFIKDLILNVDRIKDYFKKKKDTKTSSWADLGYNTNKLSKVITQGALPLATLVYTMDEINELKQVTKMDFFKDNKNINLIFENLNVLGFCIIDTASDIIYFYNYNVKTFEKYMISEIDRERKKDDKTLQSVIDLVTRR